MKHNVIVHGSPPNYDELGGIAIVDNLPTNINHIAEAVKNNPNYIHGTPICLASCWSGSSGTAQELANTMDTTVTAPTRRVAWFNGKWVMDTEIESQSSNQISGISSSIKGEWRTFSPQNITQE